MEGKEPASYTLFTYWVVVGFSVSVSEGQGGISTKDQKLIKLKDEGGLIGGGTNK